MTGSRYSAAFFFAQSISIGTTEQNIGCFNVQFLSTQPARQESYAERLGEQDVAVQLLEEQLLVDPVFTSLVPVIHLQADEDADDNDQHLDDDDKPILDRKSVV